MNSLRFLKDMKRLSTDWGRWWRLFERGGRQDCGRNGPKDNWEFGRSKYLSLLKISFQRCKGNCNIKYSLFTSCIYWRADILETFMILTILRTRINICQLFWNLPCSNDRLSSISVPNSWRARFRRTIDLWMQKSSFSKLFAWHRANSKDNWKKYTRKSSSNCDQLAY